MDIIKITLCFLVNVGDFLKNTKRNGFICKTLSVVLSLMLIILQFSGLIIFTEADTSGRIYYIDSIDGSDDNDGTTEDSAWKSLDKVNSTEFSAGEKILFKAGCGFVGQLFPKGSGAENAPIVIDMYGEGPKPVILSDGQSDTLLTLYNQEYWEINNLEITANNDKTVQYAVNFIAEDYGTVDHIYIRNCYIRDIAGSITSKITGGIFYTVKGTEIKTNFNDILVENNTLRKVDRTGITIDAYNSWNSKLKGEDEPGCWYPSTNVVMRGNFVDDIGGDGIVVKCCVGALVEYNTAKNCNARSSQANVAIWTWNSNDCILQFNEAYNTRYTSDGEGFDVDSFCENTLVQYNYSHNNDGGFILVCAPGPDAATGYYTKDTTIRYNISQNDGRLAIMYSGNITNTDFYNNTIYVAEGGNSRIIDSWDWGGSLAKGGIFANNLIYNLGDGEYDLSGIKIGDYVLFGIDIDIKNNLFYGNHPASEPYDAKKITDDPMLVSPGSGGIGITSVGGYKLKKNSPAIGSGMEIADCGDRDYYGNPIDAKTPNIGAYGGSGESEINTDFYSVDNPHEVAYIHPVSVNSTPKKQVYMPNSIAVKLTDGRDVFVKVVWDNEPLNFNECGSYIVKGRIYGTDIETFANVVVEAADTKEILGNEWDAYNNMSSQNPDIETGEYLEVIDDPTGEKGGILKVGHKDFDTKISLRCTQNIESEKYLKYETWLYLEGSINTNSYVLIKDANTWDDGAFNRAELSDLVADKWIYLNTDNLNSSIDGLSGKNGKTISSGYVTVDFVISLPAGSYLYMDDFAFVCDNTTVYTKDFSIHKEFEKTYIDAVSEWNTWVAANSESSFDDSVEFIVEDGNTRVIVHNPTSAYTGSLIQNVFGIENGTYTLSVDCRTTGYSSAVIAAENYGGSKRQVAINAVTDEMKTVTMKVPVTANRVDVTLYTNGKTDEYIIIDNVTLTKDGDDKNYILNGDFEANYSRTIAPDYKREDAVKWSKWLKGAEEDSVFVANAGYNSNSCMATTYPTTAESNFKQTIKGLEAGVTYVVTAYVKFVGTGNASLYCKSWGGTYNIAIPKTDKWVKIYREVVLAQGKNEIALEFYCNGNAGDWLMVDNVKVFDKSEPSENLILNGDFETVIGDVDYDGRFAATDLSVLRSLIMEYSVVKELAADIDENGSVDARDVVNLKKSLAEK